MAHIYETQRRVNIFLADKVRQLLAGEIESVHILTMKLNLTTEHAISTNYIDKRINILLEQYPQLRIDDGYLFVVGKKEVTK